MTSPNPFGAYPLPKSPGAVEAMRAHASHFPDWIGEALPDLNRDLSRVPTSYLRELYPYIYYWGGRGNLLAANLKKMVLNFDVEFQYLRARPMDVSMPHWLQENGLAEDLLLTYAGTELGQIIVHDNIKAMLPYVLRLQQAGLFLTAYRNVDTAELHAENMVGDDTDSPLHRYYQHDLFEYYPRAWDENFDLRNAIHQVLSIFVRIMLSAPVMQDMPTLAEDWLKHQAFCKRWQLTP